MKEKQIIIDYKEYLELESKVKELEKYKLNEENAARMQEVIDRYNITFTHENMFWVNLLSLIADILYDNTYDLSSKQEKFKKTIENNGLFVERYFPFGYGWYDKIRVKFKTQDEQNNTRIS